MSISTDHAPHHYDEKNVEFDRAPFGIVGLETAVPITLDKLVHTGLISVSRMVELMSVNPAKILHVPGGTLSPGSPADITILAPDLQVTIDKHQARQQVEEHAVSRLVVQRRRGGDDRRREDGLRECGGGFPAAVR